MTNYKLVLLWVVCLSFEAYMTGCEVVLVHRNVTDSFRVGKDGCTNDTSVCPNHADCQPDGSCLCNVNNPHFRNPVIKFVGGKLIDGDSYGCVDNSIKSFRASETPIRQCPFTPFQVIPYSHDGPVTRFSHHDQVINCSLDSLRKALAKFPDNVTEMKLQWLNESYVDLSILNRIMYFKWRRSVPNLQGTIITFSLYCKISPPSGTMYYQRMCLQAKILGTWKAGSILENTTTVPTEPTVSSTKIKSAAITLDATSPVTKNTRTVMTKSTICSCSDENSSDLSKVFIALFSICIVVIIVLGIIVGYLWKYIRRIKDEKVQVKELQNIDEKRKENMGETSVYDEVVHSRIHSDGMNEDNNGRLPDRKDEEPSNYEPLRRNPLRDENDDHNYQSLTTSQK